MGNFIAHQRVPVNTKIWRIAKALELKIWNKCSREKQPSTWNPMRNVNFWDLWKIEIWFFLQTFPRERMAAGIARLYRGTGEHYESVVNKQKWPLLSPITSTTSVFFFSAIFCFRWDFFWVWGKNCSGEDEGVRGGKGYLRIGVTVAINYRRSGVGGGWVGDGGVFWWKDGKGREVAGRAWVLAVGGGWVEGGGYIRWGRLVVETGVGWERESEAAGQAGTG